MHRAGAYAELVVVKPFGQLQRGPGVVEPDAEARHPRQPTVDDDSKAAGGRLAQRLREQLDGASAHVPARREG